MLRKKELIEYTLASLAVDLDSIQAMLEENYITYPMYDRLADSLTPLMKEHSYAAVQVISKVREPHLDFFRLYFEVHANVALPEDILRKFKTLGYCWLIRAFSMIEKDVPQFLSTIYAKFYPDQMPKLIKPSEQEKEIRNYIGLMLGQVVDGIELALEGSKVKKGKYGLCFTCKQLADYYCKDTKVPVCGVQCKKSHLELLSKNNSLNYQYPPSFREQIEKMLIGNLRRRQSPALSIDFLVAIYSFSDYVPKEKLCHPKILTLPVIYERLWMLYLSYYSKREELCQHILVSCLTVQEQFVRNMATEYFVLLAGDPRFLEVYWSFDRCGEMRLTDFLLRCLDQSRKAEFIQSLLGTLFNSYNRNTFIYEFNEISYVRSFNHDKDLNSEALALMFGEDYYQKLIDLIFRNQLLINRQKLGEYLYSNEELLRLFLKQIVTRKRDAPIDEILREIFYFINVKISDKIYRLFQILAQVYEPQHPFNEANFFTYAYFIIMIVTELNNSAVVIKPNLASVLTRVEQFCPDLAKNHKGIIEAMFDRISACPFSQQSRGILTYFNPIKIKHQGQLRSQEVVIENNELIYEIIIATNPDVVILYRICSLVVNHPAICQVFLQLLVDKLTQEPRDGFLMQAISILIEQQPNAAGYLWRQILDELQNGGGNDEQKFSLSLIIQSTSKLTDGNFKQLVRELCQQTPITSCMDHYIQLFSINRHRISLVIAILTTNYQKCDNSYLKLIFIKKLGRFLQSTNEDNLSQLLLKMIEDVALLPITEGLFIECILSIRFQIIKNSLPFWTILGKKCLEIHNEKNVQILESFMKKGGEDFYQSYLIQKTLNCYKEEHISLQILKNLQKLQPYIHQIRRDLLKHFILVENLPVIMKYFECFHKFNKSYEILLDQWGKEPEWVDKQMLGKIVESIESLLTDEANDNLSILKLYHLPKLLIKLLSASSGNLINALIRRYLERIKFTAEQKSSSQHTQSSLMKLSHFNAFTDEVHSFVKESVRKVREEGEIEVHIQEIKEYLNDLVQILHEMHREAREFQINVNMRLEMKKMLMLIKSKAHMPSLLNSSILILKSIYDLEDLLHHPNEPSLMRIFHEVEEVLSRQSQLSQLLIESGIKKDSYERICVSQANKDAIQYGQMAIEIAYNYLKLKQDLSPKDKATMKRILISILIQGCFNEQTCSFQSLAGSKLAQKVEQIFHLLK